MKYIWLQSMQKKEKEAINNLKNTCFAQDGRLPLLNLPEQPEECDGCLAAVAESGEFKGLLTCLYGGNTVEVCVLVHPKYRGRGIGMELMHRLILSTKKIPVFPVAGDDEAAAAFLSYIGKREICREMRMTLTREGYPDARPKLLPGKKAALRVTCETGSIPESDGDAPSDRQMRYTLYAGPLPIGRCAVTDGCISEVWVRGGFRGRGCGSFLLRTVIRHQFHQGRRKLFLHVTSLNIAACALYRKYGFEVTEEVVYYL